jgi:hypothetical protein
MIIRHESFITKKCRVQVPLIATPPRWKNSDYSPLKKYNKRISSPKASLMSKKTAYIPKGIRFHNPVIDECIRPIITETTIYSPRKTTPRQNVAEVVSGSEEQTSLNVLATNFIDSPSVERKTVSKNTLHIHFDNSPSTTK